MILKSWLNESNVLRCSALLELSFGISGLLIAWFSGSQAVLLDGCYSLICTLTMMANVRISRLVKESPSIEKPFGNATLEPLMLILESSLLLLLCFSILAVATFELFTGGTLPEFNLALTYELFSVFIGVTVSTLFLLVHQSTESPLILFEFQEWLLDTAMSASASVAFFLARWLGSEHPTTPYIDSVLTLLMLAILIRLPIRTFRKNYKQLLFHGQHGTVHFYSDDSPLLRNRNIVVYSMDLGRWHWVNIIIKINDHYPCPSHRELKEIKISVEQELLRNNGYNHITIQLQIDD